MEVMGIMGTISQVCKTLKGYYFSKDEAPLYVFVASTTILPQSRILLPKFISSDLKAFGECYCNSREEYVDSDRYDFLRVEHVQVRGHGQVTNCLNISHVMKTAQNTLHLGLSSDLDSIYCSLVRLMFVRT